MDLQAAASTRLGPNILEQVSLQSTQMPQVVPSNQLAINSNWEFAATRCGAGTT